MSLIWQEKAINFLQENRRYQVLLWWGFGPTIMRILCKEKGFDAKELLEKKSSRNAQVEKQCVELLEAWGEKKIHWWWPWSKKMKDIELDEKQCQRAKNYEKYFFLWRIILSLFTSVLVHRRILRCNDLVVDYDIEEGYMYKTKDSEFRTPSLEQKKEEGCMHEHTTNSEFEVCNPEQKIDVISNLRKKYNTAKFTTLEDALEAFGLPSLLQDLDNSLEMVRKNKESTEGHEKYINEKVYKRLKDLKVCAKEKELSQIGEKLEGIIQKIKSTKREMKDGIRNVLWGKSESNEDSDIYEEEERVTDLYKASFYLMRWYCDGKTEHEGWLKRKILRRETDEIDREEVEEEFTNIMKIYYKDYLAKEFKPENYVGVSKVEGLMSRCKELEVSIQKARADQEKVKVKLEKVEVDQEKVEANLRKIEDDQEKTKAKVQKTIARAVIQMEKEKASTSQIQKLLQNIAGDTNTTQQSMTQILKGTTKKQEKTSASQQQNARATNNQQGAQSDQQHDPNAQPMSRSRPSSLSSPGGDNGGQPGPSHKLDEVQQMSHNYSLHSDYSDSSKLLNR
ncbi:uncharacterized protein TNIN_36861 [Trichonephila inaurata madagascariensis]|uniref:Uncharacterized protein n=1 Tax=Trichonephila inaurata madagascariensis TaxID=2747483 RepID=A0A8X6Y5C3_9ARAC|nr:uncharacterized protein TNIN_36861 [Trichonephila inaurata madagascariensis]